MTITETTARPIRMTSPVTWEGANCLVKPGDSFYPVKGIAQVMARNAKAVCNGTGGTHAVCRWRDECLEYALFRGERFGVWGGMSERDRWKEKKRRQAEAAAVLAPVIDIQSIRETHMATSKIDRLIKGNTRTAAVATTRKADGMLGRWAETKKTPGRLLPLVKQHLLTRAQDPHRRHDLLHVSELAKSDWCPRAAYLRIQSVRTGKNYVEEAPHFQLDNIFEEGNSIHTKWQSWFWDMGVLWGQYKCVCGAFWAALAPTKCPTCGLDRDSLRYCEVNMDDPENLIVGHSDGEIRDDEGATLIEIKSVGVGTVRVEQPKTLAKYSHSYTDADGTKHSYVDHDGLWRDLRRPFASHLRQGVIYLYLRQLMTERYGWPEVKKIVFVYEYKPTQAVKEFVIGPDHAWVAEMLEDCKDVVYALENGEAPTCKDGRSTVCAKCKDMDARDKDHDAEQQVETRAGDVTRTDEDVDEVVADTSPTRGPTRITRRPDRAGRRGADEPARSVHSLGGLLRRSAGDGVRGRAGRGDVVREGEGDLGTPLRRRQRGA